MDIELDAGETPAVQHATDTVFFTLEGDELFPRFAWEITKDSSSLPVAAERMKNTLAALIEENYPSTCEGLDWDAVDWLSIARTVATWDEPPPVD